MHSMEMQLSLEEVRVIGALIEKERTTPEYYPLTLNALTNACNQKSNREPVLSISEDTVRQTLESLRSKNLALMVTGAGSRVPKYKHTFDKAFQLDDPQIAVMAILMLRGPQTVGEIRGRTGRMYAFDDLGEVTDILEQLQKHDGGPLVVQLPRQPGRKELRYAHLLSGTPEASEEARSLMTEGETGQDQRILDLENQVQKLQEELDLFRNEFLQFKKQFE